MREGLACFIILCYLTDMLTLARTIGLPASREIRLAAPESVPAGKVDILVVFQPPAKPVAATASAVPSYTPQPFPTLEELKAEAEWKYQTRKASGRDSWDELYGSMPNAFGDMVKYQRELRDEWPD
jgi:hypothetical protein